MTHIQTHLQRIHAEQFKALSPITDEELTRLCQLIREANRIFVAGKGRSALQLMGFAMRLMHLGLTVHVVDDVTTPAIRPGDLLIIGSGTGRTASLQRYAERAMGEKSNLVLITAAKDSPLHLHADQVITIQVTQDSILPMASLFETSLGLLCEITIIQLMDDLGISGDEMFSRHANLE